MLEHIGEQIYTVRWSDPQLLDVAKLVTPGGLFGQWKIALGKINLELYWLDLTWIAVEIFARLDQLNLY